MNIAICVAEFPILSETFVIDQIVAFKKMGAKVTIYAEKINHGVHQQTMDEHQLWDDLQVIGYGSNWLNAANAPLNGLRLLISHPKLCTNLLWETCSTFNIKLACRLLAEFTQHRPEKKYDFTLAHFGLSGVLAQYLREGQKIHSPLAVVFHGYDMSNERFVKKFKPLYQRKLFVHADYLLPISDYWRKRLLSWGAPDDKIRVHHMGVDICASSREKAIERQFSTPVKIIQVGRLVEKKAILDSIHAVVELHKHCAVRFTIIGGGPFFDKARQLIKHHHAESYIELKGEQHHQVVKQYLEDSDLFLLPSVIAENGDMEGIPVALMEAMAAGLVAVSTLHSGIPELIKHQHSGFLVPERQPAQLAEVLQSVIEMNEEQRKVIRANAFDAVLNEFNSHRLSEHLYSLFRSNEDTHH